MAANANEELKEAAQAMKGILDDPFATPAEEPKAEETSEESEVEAQAEAEETPEEPGEEISEQSEEVREEGAEPEPEAIELEAEDFANLLGIDTDKVIVTDDGKVSFKGSVDGEEIDANLGTLLDAYQRDANLTNRSKEIAEMRKQQEKALDDFNQQITTHAQQAAIRLEAINKAYEEELGNIDWKELQQEDPGTYAAKRVEMDQKKRQLDDMIRQTLTELDQSQKEVEAQQAELIKQKLADEKKAMHEGFKALNVKINNDLEKDVIGYMSGIFSEEELDKMTPVAPLDRLTIMAYKAMMFDKGKAKAETKQVKKVPKVLKAGAKRSASKDKAIQDKETLKRHRKEGTMDSAVAALKGRI